MTLQDSQSKVKGVAVRVFHIARLLEDKGALSTGDIAALRRMDPYHPVLAYFKLESLVLDAESPADAYPRNVLETRWAAVVQGLAQLGSLHRDVRHGHALALGTVLAKAQYSQARFARLLHADADQLLDELPMLARHLSAKRVSVDWTGAARLILSAGREKQESVRRRVARDYYGQLARQDKR